jgi:hydrogenase maturation protease
MTLAEVVTTPLLIYGIGNVGRQDDGLGPLFIERLEEMGVPPGVTLDSGYQLAPEDALTISAHHTVLFVDASVAAGAAAPYAIEPIMPASEISFSTHAMSMGSLLALCLRLYGQAPSAFALAIPAHGFDINAVLTPQAAACLDTAVRDVRAALGPV